MAKSLSDYLEELKKQQNVNRGKGSLEWYLSQIRELAAEKKGGIIKKDKEEEQKVYDSSGKVLATVQDLQTSVSRKEAIDIVKKATVRETSSIFDRSMIGKMLFYQYDAKTKQKLPFWDVFPLTFMFDVGR